MLPFAGFSGNFGFLMQCIIPIVIFRVWVYTMSITRYHMRCGPPLMCLFVTSTPASTNFFAIMICKLFACGLQFEVRFHPFDFVDIRRHHDIPRQWVTPAARLWVLDRISSLIAISCSFFITFFSRISCLRFSYVARSRARSKFPGLTPHYKRLIAIIPWYTFFHNLLAS